jgi:seryl-tRNA synthetase
MTVMPFDTHEFIKRLTSSGFEEQQAEALADAFITTQETYIAELATSQELKDVRQELKQDIAQVRQELKDVRQELKQDIAQVRQELKDVRQELKQDIAQVRQEVAQIKTVVNQDTKALELRMDNKFESIKGEIILLKWMMGIMIAGVLSLILKAFF